MCGQYRLRSPAEESLKYFLQTFCFGSLSIKGKKSMGPSQQPLFFLAQVAILLLTSLPIQAQQQELAETVSVRLSDVFTVPGTEASIPIYLSSQGQFEITEIELKISFSDDLLSFLRLERAFQGFEKTAGKLEAQSRKRQDNHSEVTIKISIEEDDEPLTDGLIGYLVFQINKEAQLGETLLETLLETEGLIVKVISQKVIQNAQSRGAKVTILSEEDLLSAITTCFFYMH